MLPVLVVDDEDQPTAAELCQGEVDLLVLVHATTAEASRRVGVDEIATPVAGGRIAAPRVSRWRTRRTSRG